MKIIIAGIVLSCFALPADAHKVQYNEFDSAFDELRQTDSSLVVGLARYCHETKKAPQKCVESLKQHYGKDSLLAAAKCMNKIVEIDPALNKYMHKVNYTKSKNYDCESKSAADGCFWHETYIKDTHKDGWGIHRHEYEPGFRNHIANVYGYEQVNTFIKNYAGNSETNKRSQGSSGGAGIEGKAGLGPLLELKMKGNYANRFDQANEKTKSGPSMVEREKVFKEARNEALDDPWSTTKKAPNYLCIKDKAICYGWAKYHNKDYYSDRNKPIPSNEPVANSKEPDDTPINRDDKKPDIEPIDRTDVEPPKAADNKDNDVMADSPQSDDSYNGYNPDFSDDYDVAISNSSKLAEPQILPGEAVQDVVMGCVNHMLKPETELKIVINQEDEKKKLERINKKELAVDYKKEEKEQGEIEEKTNDVMDFAPPSDEQKLKDWCKEIKEFSDNLDGESYPKAYYQHCLDLLG